MVHHGGGEVEGVMNKKVMTLAKVTINFCKEYSKMFDKIAATGHLTVRHSVTTTPNSDYIFFLAFLRISRLG